MGSRSLSLSMKIHPVRRKSEFQQKWEGCVDTLGPKYFKSHPISELGIIGAAPKNFIAVYEYERGEIRRGKIDKWPRYVAKVGSKNYPNESFTEHLFTRIGQAFRVDIADSRIAIVDRQVRFMSRYFLKKDELLVHGAQLFIRLLDEEMVDQITKSRMETDFFTHQTAAMV